MFQNGSIWLRADFHLRTKEDKEFAIEAGSIDYRNIQERALKIMEGGKEAFTIRKNIYRLWGTGNS
jgi:hypothetical protein